MGTLLMHFCVDVAWFGLVWFKSGVTTFLHRASKRMTRETQRDAIKRVAIMMTSC
ncbi:hypothetical protein HanIR_Chr06g0278401 [Helianthus annuus]|nr:hypothetical protein HanIR_Chr06g0278401 [Helianthus annuus]